MSTRAESSSRSGWSAHGKRAAVTLLLAAFSAVLVAVAVAGGFHHAAAAAKGREVVVTDVSCLEGLRESTCLLSWVNDLNQELRAGVVGAEGVEAGDVVTLAPEDAAAAPANWAETPGVSEPGGVGRVMLLGPTALFVDVLLPLLVALGCAVASAATWGRWASSATPGRDAPGEPIG